jgi:hypothetical protein
MKIGINVPEDGSLFKECQSEKIFEMVRLNVQEMVGKRNGALSNLKR